MGGKAKGGSGGGSGKGGGAAKGGGGGNSSKGSGGGRDSMKAPGGGGGYISRGAFESNPQGYFSGLHSAGKAKRMGSGGSTLGGGSSNSNKGRVMKAPGGGGSHISRQVFENNPKSYFADLRAGQNKDTQTSGCHIM